jgi:heat shock protein HslJ
MKTVGRLLMSAGVMLGAAACGTSGGNLTSSTQPPAEVGRSSGSQGRLGLFGDWQLATLTESGQSSVTVAEPQRFTASFGTDGLVALRADCNRCSGSYSADGAKLTVGPMACTSAYCSTAPLDTTFASLVQESTTWMTANGGLELSSDAGVLKLRR